MVPENGFPGIQPPGQETGQTAEDAVKPYGCSILFVNTQNRILLVLRDDIPAIPCPGMWDLPGGHVEAGETPAEAIQREILEEMNLDIGVPTLFRVFDFHDRVEHVFQKAMDFDVADITLTEGQKIAWFAPEDLDGISLAFGFNRVVNRFIKASFLDTSPENPI